MSHAQRFGGTASVHTERLFRRNLRIWTKLDNPGLWAGTKLNIGSAQILQAKTKNHADGLRLWKKAIASLEESLDVLNPSAHSFNWGRAQNNLCVCKRNLGEMIQGYLGYKALLEAKAAGRAALTVKSSKLNLEEWAETLINLGGVFWSLAKRMVGEEARKPLIEALSIYGAICAEITAETHPDQWGATNTSIGNACNSLARISGPQERIEWDARAVRAHRAASDVIDSHANPVLWAMTQGNLGLAFEAMGDWEAERRAEAYTDAIKCFDAALTVYDPVHMAYDHGTATRARARVAAKLAILD